MRLTRLHIQKMPGIDTPIDLGTLGPTTNVVIGPNASGKSSLVRAVRALLYPETDPSPEIVVEARFEDGEVRYDVVRVGSSVTWRRDGVQADRPTLVDVRFLGCYTLRVEDLMATGRTDDEIADAIARAMAGGYDLAEARKPFELKSTHGKKERGELDDAQKQLSATQGKLDALRDEEKRLDALMEERNGASAASDALPRYDEALNLVEDYRERLALEERAATFLPDLDALDGGERERLDTLEEKLAMEREGAREAGERARLASERLERTGLGDAELDATAIKGWAQRVAKLETLEQEAAATARDLDGAEKKLAQARADLGGDPDVQPRVTPSVLSDLEAALDDRRGIRARIEAARERAGLLEGEEPREGTLQSARRARDVLLEWLATPEPAATAPAPLGPTLLVAATAALGIAVAATIAHPAWLALLIPIAAGVYLAWASRKAAPTEDPRARVRTRFEALGVAGPTAWEANAVRVRLQEADAELRALEETQERAKERTKLEVEAERVRGDLAKVEERLADLVEQAGFEPVALDASFHLWAKQLHAYGEARSEVEDLRGRLEGLRDEVAEKAAVIVEALKRFDAAPDAAAPEAAVLRTYLDRLEGRVQERNEAQLEVDQARKDEGAADDRADDLRKDVAKLLRKARLDPEDESAPAELDARLAQLEAWRDLQRDLHQYRQRVTEREAALAGHDDLLEAARALREDDLRAQRAGLQENADRYEALVGEIKEIEAALKEAKQARSLERDLARRDSAEAALQDRLNDACRSAAGALLLDTVEEEYADASRPPALKQAATWFATFTHHAFELVFEDGTFAARETATGRRLALHELSTGTRTQLLLAVRVAFTDRVEDRLPKLPLFLDEALTTSDSDRFAEVAGGLAELAQASGRQVFYLSARAEDGAQWEAVMRERVADCEVIDLAHERRLGRAPIDLSSIELPERPATPSPDGHTPASYAEALAVPPIDLWAGAEAVHAFHLLRDDLELLHRVLDLGAERLGTLHSRLDSPGVEAHLGASTCAKLLRRIRAAEAWMDGRRTGRGRPVTRATLERSGAVSENFIEQVTDLMNEVRGDAQAILDGLSAKAVTGFRTNKRDELEAYFLEHGHLSQDPEPSEDELRERAYRAYVEDVEADPVEAHRDATRLCDALLIACGTPDRTIDADETQNPGSVVA